MIYKQTTRLLLLGLLLLVLTACGADIDQTVIFREGEAWEASIEMSIAQSTLAMFSSQQEIEEELNVWAGLVEERGGRASWDMEQDEGILRYVMDAEGTGLELLNEAVFGGDANLSAVIVDGERQIDFRYRGTEFADSGSYTLELIGGEILSSNGQIIDDGRVQWVDPGGRMEATLTERGGLNWPLLLALVLLLAAAVAGFLYWQNQQGVAGTAAQPAFCRQCGAELAPGARFCPKCGEPQ